MVVKRAKYSMMFVELEQTVPQLKERDSLV